MPISGIVVTLSSDEELAARAAARVGMHPGVELGARQGRKLPLTLDTPNRGEDKAAWKFLEETEGVDFVDVVFIHFDEDPADQSAGQGANR